MHEPLEVIEADINQPLPVALVKAEPDLLRGTIVSRGIGRGRPVVCSNIDLYQLAKDVQLQSSSNVDSVLTKALFTLCQQLEQEIVEAESKNSPEEITILKAHLQIAGDSLFSESLAKFSSQGNPIHAIARASDALKAPLLKSQSNYMRERALDIDDLCARLAGIVLGKPLQQPIVLSESSVVIADILTPSEFLALDKQLLKGVVLAEAGQTSHTVILARSFGVPVLTAVEASMPLLIVLILWLLMLAMDA